MSSIKVGDWVRHPSRGQGIVSTVIYSPLTGKVIRAWVEFPFYGTIATRKFVCFADDLTVAPMVAERPTLAVVKPEAAS